MNVYANCTACIGDHLTWCLQNVSPFHGVCLTNKTWPCAEPYIAFRDKCPDLEPPSTALLLFDPCVFLCALVIVFLLVVGSKRSVEAEVSIGASLEHLKREKLSPARMLLFLCPLVMGSGVLVLFFFFPAYMYFVFLLIITVAALTSTSTVIGEFVQFLLKKKNVDLDRRLGRFRRSTVLSCACGLLATFCWAATNYWLFVDVVAFCIVMLALEKAVLPAPRYATIISLVMMIYDGFWVYTHVLQAPSTPSPTPTPFSNHTASTTASYAPSTVPSVPTPFPTPAPTPQSAMLKMALGIINNRPGCEFSHFAFFRACLPTLPMVFIYERFLTQGQLLLGLGDVVLPGIFLSALYRLDVRCGWRRLKSYFVVALIGYVVGLAITMIVAFGFQSGQPALIFLIPCTQLPVWILALCRKQFLLVWRGYGQVVEKVANGEGLLANDELNEKSSVDDEE